MCSALIVVGRECNFNETRQTHWVKSRPYTPAARAQQQENQANWLANDPLVKCYMPGIPRANYLPFPFQIVQSPDHIIMAYEFASASRIVYVDQPDFEAPILSWMGHNLAHFEGDTLVIEVTDQVPETWFDHAGNHHTDALRVTERRRSLRADRRRRQAGRREPGLSPAARRGRVSPRPHRRPRAAPPPARATGST